MVGLRVIAEFVCFDTDRDWLGLLIFVLPSALLLTVIREDEVWLRSELQLVRCSTSG